MRVIVCGGREFGDRDLVFRTLDALHRDHFISMVIEGGCRAKGRAMTADLLANEWALSRETPCFTVPAKWSVHERAAGPIRNGTMLKLKPVLCVAFAGGRGTADMCRQAAAAGIPVVSIASN